MTTWRSTNPSQHFETLALHAGYEPDPTTGAAETRLQAVTAAGMLSEALEVGHSLRT